MRTKKKKVSTVQIEEGDIFFNEKTDMECIIVDPKGKFKHPETREWVSAVAYCLKNSEQVLTVALSDFKVMFEKIGHVDVDENKNTKFTASYAN